MAGKKEAAKAKEDKKVLQAEAAVLEDFFEDFYQQRRRIYFVNFIRGVWFGIGTLVGGTLVLAAVLWLLSLFESVPFLGDIVDNVQQSIEDARQK